MTYDTARFEPFAIESNLGVKEYSVSGWAKWTKPEKQSPWNLLFRLTTTHIDKLTNAKNPGDRTLLISKNNEVYLFSTYSCVDEENTCAPNVA